LPHLPRKPDSVAAVMSYLCASRMVEELEGSEYLSSKQMQLRVEGLKKRYTYGKIVGMDERERWAIDEL
jgi:hypothetical protein